MVLKCMYLARFGRPDLLWSVNTLKRSVTTWNKVCRKKLPRLTRYSHQPKKQRQFCHVRNQIADCKLGSFQHASFARDLRDPKSTSGGVYCAYLDHIRLFPFFGRVRSKPQILTAVQNLKLFRLTLVHAWTVYFTYGWNSAILGMCLGNIIK